MKLTPFFMIVLAAISYLLGKRSQHRPSHHHRSTPFPLDEEIQWQSNNTLMRVTHPTRQTHRIAELIEALDDTNPQARADAAAQLEGLGSMALNELMSALRRGKMNTRQSAAQILGSIGDPCALPALIAGLKDPNMWVRAACAEALGAICDPNAIDALKETLEDEDVDVCWSARTALINIGTPEALAAINL
ncbi:MAG: HEAT repeat domain-containing protein [Anaerolineae bacterium]|jgi:hypothetical protein|nr:HEAT repeat domain-containing protein [Anaerolineae bacterium]